MMRKNLPFYIAGFLAVYVVRRFYATATSEALDWLLRPTARLASLLSGVPFERTPGLGYVNHHVRFIIAPSCAGVRFMLITFSALLYSFVHRMKSVPLKCAWTALCLCLSYWFTILVNGVRIVLSLHLLRPADKLEWLGTERLHTIEGAVLFLGSLFVVYQIADFATGSRPPLPGRQGRAGAFPAIALRNTLRLTAPVLWYMFFMLLVPLLKRLILP